ncbi:peptide methionine sulfoxide reductase family protein, partial [Vibrio parahaemolyticus VPTS-2010]
GVWLLRRAREKPNLSPSIFWKNRTH